MEILKNYRIKPWPKLEIPALDRRQIIGLAIFTVLIMAIGWLIYLTPLTRVKYFAMLALVIPLLFLLKSRHMTIAGFLALQIILAFLFVGNKNYALGILAGLAGAIIAFQSPILFYAILIFWIWFEVSPMASLVSHPIRLEFIIGIAFMAGWYVKERILTRTKPAAIFFPEKWPTLLFLLWALTGFALWAIEPFPAGWSQIKFILIGVLFLLISPLVLRTPKLVDVAAWVWIVMGALGAAAAYWTKATGYSPPIEQASGWGTSLGAMGMQHNFPASFMSFAFFIMLPVFYLLKKQLFRLIMLFTLFFTFGGILLQQSKGPTVGLFAGTGFFLLAESFFKPNVTRLRVLARILVLILILMALILSIYYLGFGSQIGGYASLFYDPAGSEGMEIRYILWTAAHEMFMMEGHPIRGLGVSAFWSLAFKYGLEYGDISEATEYQQQGINPHNLYIDTVLHYGIIGLALILWLMIGNLIRLRRGYKQFLDPKYRYLSLGVFCGMLAFYFSCLFDFAVFFISRYWLFLGFSVAMMNIAARAGQTDDVA